MININNKKVIKEFGKRVRLFRKAKKLTQESLANEASIPLSQMGRIERGEVNVTISSMYALANAMRIPMEQFFKASDIEFVNFVGGLPEGFEEDLNKKSKSSELKD